MQNPEDHIFGQDKVQPGERKTLVVVLLTTCMMVVEIVVGITSGSMALLADGLHMASHAATLMVNVLAYRFARRHASDPRFTFGTGKVNALAGFAGSILLVGFAVIMVTESIHRMVSPISIDFNYAIAVAIIGLIVNAFSAMILGNPHRHDPTGHSHHDHNLHAAYLHVIADALTSVLAIFALVAARYKGWVLLDPLMGIVGAVLVTRWGIGLIKDTSATLLDTQAPDAISEGLRRVIEKDGLSKLADAHIWSIGPGIFAAALIVNAPRGRPALYYRQLISSKTGVVHVTIEVTYDSDENH